MRPGIYKRGEVEYDGIDAVNISSLLWMAKSAKHYQARPRRQTKPLSLGTAAHSATLEPERFASDFAVWTDTKKNGDMAARKGTAWEAFLQLHSGQTVITADEHEAALDIALAVRRDERCSEVLASGNPEVTLVWTHELTGFLCKGRVDWLCADGTNGSAGRLNGAPMFADLKTACDITHGPFMNKCAKLHYHTRMAWYGDGLRKCLGMPQDDELETLILAVESGKPHDCAVYWMDNEEVLETGRNEYEDLMAKLRIATDFGEWHGVANNARIRYTLPRWAVEDPEDDMDPELDWSKPDV